MRRTLFLGIAAAVSLQAATMEELFSALKKSPVTRQDVMQTEYAKLAAKRVNDNFYPTASLFATYEHYSSPTNLRPMSPVESQKIGASAPLPFARTIERLGGKVSMPLFAKELFALGDKAEAMARSAEVKKRLNLLQNEAVLLGSDASWLYMESLQKAMDARKRSIQKILEDTRIKVDSGRAPGITLDKMEESINRLDIAINDIGIKKEDIRSKIAALTGVSLTEPAALKQKRAVNEGAIFATKPLEYLVEAKGHDIDAAYAKLYPKAGLSATWSENYGQNAEAFAPDLSDDVHRSYGNYMIGVTIPLFEKGNYTQIEQARIDLQKEKLRLAETKQELEAKTKALKSTLKLYSRSIELAKKSVTNRKSLLRYAKVAFDTGRLSEEEYLRYEDGLLEAQSKLFEAKAKRWQTVAQLAVIYGDDLAEIVE